MALNSLRAQKLLFRGQNAWRDVGWKSIHHLSLKMQDKISKIRGFFFLAELSWVGRKVQTWEHEKMKWSVKIFLEWQNGRKNKNPAIEPCAFTADKSKWQCLDTDITNVTTESLNFWLIKFVGLILCKSKFIVCEIS